MEYKYSVRKNVKSRLPVATTSSHVMTGGRFTNSTTSATLPPMIAGWLTLTAGIPIESIARMMGHTNIDSTQVYAQVTDRKISSDMDRLMERRKPAVGKEAAG